LEQSDLTVDHIEDYKQVYDNQLSLGEIPAPILVDFFRAYFDKHYELFADACGDRHEDPRRANPFDMNARYGDVVNEQEAIIYLAEVRK
jgi:hypothetical protein